MSADDRRDQVLLFAAGLLEASEAEEVREFLRSGGAEAAGLAAEARDLVDGLAEAVPETTPSAATKGRVLELIGQPKPASTLSFPKLILPAAAAAAAAIVTWAVLTFTGPTPPDPAELDALRSALAAEAEERSEIESELAGMDEELAELEAEVERLGGEAQLAADQVAMLRGSGVAVIDLAATTNQPDASARMFWESKDGYYCYLHARGLAPSSDGEVYALWLLTDDDRTLLVGSFEVAAGQGEATVWVRLPEETVKAVGAFVTSEAADPGSQPLGARQLESQIM